MFLSKTKLLIKRLLLRKSRTVSQAGQDYWVYGEVFNEKRNGYFLDIGAHDGISISNTYLLEWRYNWDGLCIEANPQTYFSLTQNRKAKCINACLDDKEGEVEFALRGIMGGIISNNLDNQQITAETAVQRIKTVPLIKVLEEYGAPRVIDYLSIDVEGAEDRVLGAFQFDEYRFNCITIERPSEQLRNLFQRYGYILIKEIPGLDCFYVHRDHREEFLNNILSFYAKKRFALLNITW